ncbi:unnamed protein product, partial [Cylicostephanus goldi]
MDESARVRTRSAPPVPVTSCSTVPVDESMMTAEAKNSDSHDYCPDEAESLPPKGKAKNVTAKKRVPEAKKNALTETKHLSEGSRDAHARATSAAVSDKGASVLDQLLPLDNSKMKTPPSASDVSILDKLLPDSDGKSGTSPSNIAGMSFCDYKFSRLTK